MQTYCTIINNKYLPFASVLHQSLVRHEPGTRLQVLVIDAENTEDLSAEADNEQPEYHTLNEIIKDPIAAAIRNKYEASNPDHFRWALKPVFICHLLGQGFSKVIFTDPDVYFIGRHGFLFDLLERHTILLSPHWGNIHPLQDEDGLFSVLKNGVYSAAFVAAGIKGIAAMKWWAEVCHYKMEQRAELGLYDDQKYLNLIPLMEPGTGILYHRGCNLASINIDTCKREIVNGRLLINGSEEPVFIHFTRDTVTNILNRNDQLLRPWLDKYAEELSARGLDLCSQFPSVHTDSFRNILYPVKHRLRLRTRLKRFLFKLAEKL